MKNTTNLIPQTYNDPLIFAMSLDRKRQKEHIVFGASSQVRSCLEGRTGFSVLFDAERPLGTLLVEHESQSQAEWNFGAHSLLAEALAFPIGKAEQVKSAKKFLDHMLSSNNAICRYTACRSLSVYEHLQTPLGSSSSKGEYENAAFNVSRSFNQVIWGDKKNRSVSQSLNHLREHLEHHGFTQDLSAEIRYPGRAGKDEWIIVTNSLYPVILYYLTRLDDWKVCFCKCSNCGKIFVAPSKHYSLCSAVCRKAQGRQNKREYDERAQRNGYDIDYKNTSQRMRNRLSSLKKQPNITTDELQKVQDAFASFRKCALQKKKNIKTPKDRKEFQNWLFSQERAFEDMCLSAHDSQST